MSFRLGRQMPLWFAAAVVVSQFVPSSSRGAASILFDATKAEMAGNADWVVDADLHNLGVDPTTHQEVTGTGSSFKDSNPQITPTGPQSAITGSTSETYWTGALSSWGVDAAQRGFTVKTLPYNGAITYGVASNAQDLKNYKVYVVDEPNILFSAAEKTALLNFVKNGGGLMLISDHGSSDRNNDGNDSTDVWNDLFTNNGTVSNPFGMKFNADSVSPTGNADGSASDPITRGKAGNVTSLTYNSGSTITIDPTKNSTVAGAVWTTSSHTTTNVMAAYATYGTGRVVAVGDSSPTDDGTGDPGDTLFDGWSADKVLFENATLWLSGSTTASAPPDVVPEPAGLVAATLVGVLGRRRRGSRCS